VSACQCRQVDVWIIAQGCDGFQRHVASPLDRPFVVLLEQDRSNEPDYRVLVGEDADEGRPMTDREHSAVVALHHRSHPERDGGVAVEGNPVCELMRQAVAFIERWNAELNERDDRGAPRPSGAAAPTLQDDDAAEAVISLCFDRQVLAGIDADAKRLGISRADWLHFAVGERLAGR
jgi:hypothetical protein